MSTEVWFRNPDLYIRELVECGMDRIAWDRGYLVKRRIDPDKHAQLYFNQALPNWRALLVGEQGTAELRAGHPISKPYAVYPTWAYGDETSLLEEIVAKPVGADFDICADMSVPIDQRPVFGQDHRVVITDVPPANSGPGKAFYRFLKELQEDYPSCMIHVHGLYSFRIAFGMGYAAADFEARSTAAKGKIILPSGKEVKFEAAMRNPQWITVLGFQPVDLKEPRKRCMYNIKSSMWAGMNYAKLFRFQTRGGGAVDADSSDDDFTPQQTSRHTSSMLPMVKQGDQQLCNSCSLQDQCKYFRVGAVCTVPGAEPNELARLFKSRDADLIIDGLGTLLATQTNRLEQGMELEQAMGELDPEVTKALNSTFSNGVKLAKLINPALSGGPKVNINLPGSQGATVQVGNTTPQQLIGAAVRELRGRGIDPADITEEMISNMLGAMAASGGSSRPAIEGEVVN